MPDDPIEILLDELSRRGWTQQKFAHVIGRPPQAVSEIINRKKQMTPTTALQFGAALDTPAETWLHMQSTWNLWMLESTTRMQVELALVRDRAKRAAE